jgi:hypothetical protein
MNRSVLTTEALAVEARPLDAGVTYVDQKNVHKIPRKSNLTPADPCQFRSWPAIMQFYALTRCPPLEILGMNGLPRSE